jgi:hypothetical protein
LSVLPRPLLITKSNREQSLRGIEVLGAFPLVPQAHKKESNQMSELNDNTTMFAQQTPTGRPETISEARLAANRENAQKSSGPVTAEGKAKSSLNAVKHGLTGATVMFAKAEDAKNYARHVADYQQQLQPVGPEESALVQSIADIRWRLATIPVLELGILAMGSAEIIDTNPDYWNKPENQTKLVLEARRRNEKELRNLQLQENRLARRREREAAELRTLQAARKAREEEALPAAAKAALLAQYLDPHSTAPIHIPGLGFDFSNDRFESYMRRLKSAQREILLQEALAEAAEETQILEAAA